MVVVADTRMSISQLLALALKPSSDSPSGGCDTHVDQYSHYA